MEKFVLIADDDPAVCRLVETIVTGEGLIAAIAKDGKEAYKALQSGVHFAAVIVDVQMPYIDGTDIVKFMQSEPRFAKVPVLVMTGDKSARASAAAIAAGALAFLPKPFTNRQLRTALQTLLVRAG